MKNKVGIIVVSIAVVAALVVSGIVFTPMIVKSSREKAYTEFIEANDYSSAAAIIEKMLLKDDTKENKERLAKAYFILDQYEKAAPLYKELLELDTQNVEYMSDYSKVLVETKNYAEAIAIYESLKKATADSETYAMLSYLYEETGDPANALLNIEYMLEKEPNDALLNFKAGLLNKELANMDSALLHLEKATMFDLQNEEYAIVYASSLHDEGQKQTA
ncbi:MAG: tetratricopeptide repeat protein, partial [Clostridia bacterium]